MAKKNPHAVALGRLGGKVGGKARAAALSPTRRKAISAVGGKASARKLTAAQRSERARKAGRARWKVKRSS